MKIAVNTRLLLSGKLEGIGWFAAETLSRITRGHPEHEFIFIFDRPWSDEFIFSSNITPVRVSPQARHPLLWYAWFEYSIPRILKRHGADLFFSPDGYLSLSAGLPSLAAIHDINFMHHPGFHNRSTRAYYRHFFPKYATRADRLVTVSEYSRKDISNMFGIPASGIDVVYNGASEIYAPTGDDGKAKVRDQYAGGTGYFLFVGSFHERKNIRGLLAAFEAFKAETGSDLKLLLAGEVMNGYSEMKNLLKEMSYRHEVVFCGRMEPPGLKELYGAATALVYIPFFEGFGIPVLEAMKCATPVITSNLTSLPEVAGDAALLVDPYDIRAVAGAMARLAADPELGEKIAMKGVERARRFSWDHTAELLWQSIERVIDGTGRRVNFNRDSSHA